MFQQGAMPRKATCSSRIQTEEEHGAEQEVDSAKDETEQEVQPMKTTPNFGKKMETTEEHSEEGEATMPVEADKTTQSNSDIAE